MGLAHAELLGPTLTQKDLWPFTSDFTQGEERLILWCFGTGMVLECFGSLKGDVWQILIVFYRLPGWYPWCGIYTLRCHFIALADSTQVTQVTVLQDRNSAVSQPSHTQPSTQHLENLEASTQKNTKKKPLEYLWNSMNISCQNRCQVMKFLTVAESSPSSGLMSSKPHPWRLLVLDDWYVLCSVQITLKK